MHEAAWSLMEAKARTCRFARSTASGGSYKAATFMDAPLEH